MCIFLGQLITTSLRDSEVTHQLARPGQPWQRHEPRNLSRVPGAVIEPHRPSVRRSSPEGKPRLKNATDFSNLLVLVAREANTSSRGKKYFCSFESALSHPPQSGRKKKRNRFWGCFVWLSGSFASLASGKEVGVIWGAPLHSGPETLPSISHQKKKSSRVGNWPRFPRAEIESSALNHFLCLVTMHEGISTNPLSCHGFRSWTWAKTAWDIPALSRHRTPFDLFGS